jgi:hypothetical protein
LGTIWEHANAQSRVFGVNHGQSRTLPWPDENSA